MQAAKWWGQLGGNLMGGKMLGALHRQTLGMVGALHPQKIPVLIPGPKLLCDCFQLGHLRINNHKGKTYTYTGVSAEMYFPTSKFRS